MGGGALDRYYDRVLSQYKRNPLTLLQEGVSINECILSLFLEYWCEVAPVLDFECAYVPD